MTVALAQLHAEPAAGLPAALVLIGAIVIFHGSVYVLVALNTGWRFGYWITGASFGGLAFFLSIFWLLNALGPRGPEPHWYPIAVGEDQISETTFNENTFTTPTQYPDDPWKEPSKTDPLSEESDPFKASASNCVTFDPDNEDKVHEREREIAKLKGPTRTVLEGKFGMRERLVRETETCEEAFKLLPSQDSVPKVDGQPVAVLPDITGIRYAEEDGILLGQAEITPNTYDKRVTGDPEGRKALQVGDSFKVLAYKDPGALRYPAIVYTILSTLWFAFHLWGLNHAEKLKLTPVA